MFECRPQAGIWWSPLCRSSIWREQGAACGVFKLIFEKLERIRVQTLCRFCALVLKSFLLAVPTKMHLKKCSPLAWRQPVIHEDVATHTFLAPSEKATHHQELTGEARNYLSCQSIYPSPFPYPRLLCHAPKW